METRQVTQGHIFFIVLNNIYSRAEDRYIVAVSDDRDKLIDFYKSNLLQEGFRDENGMYRSFKEGIFYDFNPPLFEELHDCIKDDWILIDDIEKIKSQYYFVS